MLGQAASNTEILSNALAPFMGTIKAKISELAAPAAKQAAEAARPVIREEFKNWIPAIALLIGLSIGVSMLIGTQLPRWNIGKKK